MKRGLEAVPAVWAILLAVASCSVKEDRTDCPCRLDIILSEDISSPSVAVWGGNGASRCFDAVIDPVSDGTLYSVSVPRGTLGLHAFEMLGGIGTAGKDFLISAGCQADSLYAFCAEVDCSGESAQAAVSTRKQFATVFLRIAYEGDAAAAVSRVSVRGNVCGISAATLSPIAGEFLYETVPDSDGGCTFRLPRQDSGALALDLCFTDGTSSTVDIGTRILSEGYDWSGDALGDILLDLEVGTADISVSVGVCPWEVVDLYERM